MHLLPNLSRLPGLPCASVGADATEEDDDDDDDDDEWDKAVGGRQTPLPVFNNDSYELMDMDVEPTEYVFADKEVLKRAVGELMALGFRDGKASHPTYGPISQWNVSRVRDFSELFAGYKDFNGDISKWKVQFANDMSSMFEGAESFNVDISKWDVSGVENMDQMFERASCFNHSLLEWGPRLKSLTRMDYMFTGATAFFQNHGLRYTNQNDAHKSWFVGKNVDLSTVFSGFSKVTAQKKLPFTVTDKIPNRKRLDDMVDDFLATDPSGRKTNDSYYPPIGNWDVSMLHNFKGVFKDRVDFNGDVRGWNVAKAETMESMFENARAFNWDISNWSVDTVKTFFRMFRKASNFQWQSNVEASWSSRWSSSSVRFQMFILANGSTNDPSILTNDKIRAAVDDILNTAQRTWTHPIYGPIEHWETSQVTNMKDLFKVVSGKARFHKKFDPCVSDWDVSKVTNFSGMFSGLKSFTNHGKSLDGWDVSQATDMSSMFQNCILFNSELPSWSDKLGNVRNMTDMFNGAKAFRGIGLETWDVCNVQHFTGMFGNTSSMQSANLRSWRMRADAQSKNMFTGSKILVTNKPQGECYR